MQGLNVSSPEADLLGRVVLGFPKPLECTDSVFLPALWPSGLQWREPNVVLSLDRSSLGWLESLKLSVARCCLWSDQPSVLFCFYFIVFFSRFRPPLGIHSSLCFLSLFMALKPFVPRLFGSSSTSIESPSAAVLGVPYSASSSARREWPHVLL